MHPTTTTINADNLKPLIEKLIEELQEQNKLSQDLSDDQKEALVKDVTANIMGNVNLSKGDFDIRDNRQALAKLVSVLTATILFEHKYNKDKELFPEAEPRPQLDKEKLQDKEELKEKLLPLFAIMNELTPSPKPGQKHKLTDEEVKKAAEKAANEMAEKMDKNKEQIGNQKEAAATAAATYLASLFGVDPSGESNVERLTTIVLGNVIGLPDVNPGGGYNFMAKQNTAEPGKEDPTGAELSALVNAVAEASPLMDNSPLENTLAHVVTNAPILGH